MFLFFFSLDCVIINIDKINRIFYDKDENDNTLYIDTEHFYSKVFNNKKDLLNMYNSILQELDVINL